MPARSTIPSASSRTTSGPSVCATQPNSSRARARAGSTSGVEYAGRSSLRRRVAGAAATSPGRPPGAVGTGRADHGPRVRQGRRRPSPGRRTRCCRSRISAAGSRGRSPAPPLRRAPPGCTCPVDRHHGREAQNAGGHPVGKNVVQQLVSRAVLTDQAGAQDRHGRAGAGIDMAADDVLGGHLVPAVDRGPHTGGGPRLVDGRPYEPGA